MDTKILFALFLLCASIYATDVTANFRDNIPLIFNTDMRLTTDFTATSGGNTVHDGDQVCGGGSTTIHVAPTVSAKWAVSYLDAVVPYPVCTPPYYCSVMINAGALNTNSNIHWLSPAIFNKHKTWGDAGGFYSDFSIPQAQEYYNDLSVFVTQPVSYTVNPSDPNIGGKEGGVNVFCKGKFTVRDGTTVIGTPQDMPSANAVDVTINSNGVHKITTSLDGVQCIGVVVKHPLDTSPASAQPNFVMNYYSLNAPIIAQQSAQKTITVTVTQAGGSCQYHKTGVDLSANPGNQDLTLVHIREHNDGDMGKVTSVTTSNPGSFTASPFPVGTCNILGFPSGICPSDNGFNVDIPPGGTKDIYVLVEKVGAGSGTVLTLHMTNSAASCGTTSTCSDQVDLSGGPAFCSITPPSLTYGTLEVAQFNVACEDFGHNPVSCTGDNWYWADGLAGGFVEKDNTHALAYPTSAPGASGTLRYKSSTGLAACLSNVITKTPDYQCEFIPASANLHYNDVKHFQLNCFDHNVQKAPDSADYNLIDGLAGTTTNGNTAGVDYTAPNLNTNGKLQGFGQFNSATPPVLGAVALAPIQVTGNNTNNSTGCTGPNCGNNPGNTQYCSIGNELASVFQGFTGWVSLKCGQHANETCVGVQWSVSPASTATQSCSGNCNTGTSVTIIGAKGSSGRLIATVNNDAHQSCYFDFVVGERACWEIS
jgi:hypothetical protein